MNKIQTINLGGNPFTIDDDAYEYLQAYIRSLKKHFNDTPGRDEIINDIEARISELLLERVEGKSIVSLREIREVIVIMGSPEEFGADPIDEKTFASDKGTGKIRTGKRLFKDPDDKVILGVCSGIAKYFGIEDPTWIRLAFALGIIGGGIGGTLYIILAMILPKAKTAADRLAMRGEPIDYESIAKNVQAEFENLSKEFGSNVDDETKRQWNAGVSTAGKVFRKGGGFLSSIFAFFGHLFGNIIPILSKAVPVIFRVFSALVIFAIAMMILGMLFGWSYLWPFSHYFIAGSRASSGLAMMNGLFLGLIPMIFVLFLAARLYNGTRLPRAIAAGLGGLWILNAFMGIGLGVSTARQFSVHYDVNKTLYEGKIASNTLYINTGEKKEHNGFGNLGNVWIEDNKMVLLQNNSIHLALSKDDQLHIYVKKRAAGATSNEAKLTAQGIDDVAKVDGNTLYVNNYLDLHPGEKMRDQHVLIQIELPVGMNVKVADQIWSIDGDQDNKKYQWQEFGGKSWQMTKDGLLCQDCTGMIENNNEVDVLADPVGFIQNSVEKSVHEALAQNESENTESLENASDELIDATDNLSSAKEEVKNAEEELSNAVNEDTKAAAQKELNEAKANLEKAKADLEAVKTNARQVRIDLHHQVKEQVKDIKKVIKDVKQEVKDAVKEVKERK